MIRNNKIHRFDNGRAYRKDMGRRVVSEIGWGKLLLLLLAGGASLLVVLSLSDTTANYHYYNSPSFLPLATGMSAYTATFMASQKVYDIVSTATTANDSSPRLAPELEFLDLVDMSITRTSSSTHKIKDNKLSKRYNIQPRPLMRTLNEAHLEGLIHTGVWIFVTAFSPRKGRRRRREGGDLQVLLLKRGPQLVTCPNAWGLVGEHSNGDETPDETVQRALVEELWGGTTQYHPVDKNDKNDKRGNHRVAFVRNITEHPVYYLRDYGPSRQHRIDRQITYLYEVRMRNTSDQVALTLDDEVADHQWISLNDFRDWMQRDSAAAVGGSVTKATAPQEYHAQDFCHSTILELGQFSLLRLLTVLQHENL